MTVLLPRVALANVIGRRFMLKAKPGSKPPLQARLVAVTLADQAGRAFGASQAARSAS